MSDEPTFSDRAYRIYDLLPPGKLDHVDVHETPLDLDYKSGLRTSLHKLPEISSAFAQATQGQESAPLGLRIKTTFYRDYNPAEQKHSHAILEKSYDWLIDSASNVAVYVEPKVCWYLSDGTLDTTNAKLLQKRFYSPEEQAEELERRRRNQVNTTAKVVIGALIQGGMDQATAYAQGSAYWGSLTDERVRFVGGSKSALQSRISTDTDPAWVPQVKAYALAELT